MIKAKYNVVVYGGSGYTGMLVMDALIDQGIPFTAAGRSAVRMKEMMDTRVVSLESAIYEIVEVEHSVEALTMLFADARVVCNTVGPFIRYGETVVQACLNSGCHYLDTTGEQAHLMNIKTKFNRDFLEAGLLCSPSTAYMYTMSEIACHLALETPGVDQLDVACLPIGTPTVGSTNTIVEMFKTEQFYKKDGKMVQFTPAVSFDVVCPEYLEPMFTMPWGGSTLPVYFENNPKVRSIRALTGFANSQDLMRNLNEFWKMWEAEIKHGSEEEQNTALATLSQGATSKMPSRETIAGSRSVDYVIGRGNLASTKVTIRSVVPYIATGSLQAAAAVRLLENDHMQSGVVSACQAFGYRNLLAHLKERGIARENIC